LSPYCPEISISLSLVAITIGGAKKEGKRKNEEEENKFYP